MDWAEHAARAFETTPPRWATPGELAVALDARTVQTPALDLIDQALVETFNTPDGRLAISLAPQEGKSQRASRRFPLWALTQNPHLRVAVVSYGLGVARRWGRAIRDDITQHGDQLGLTVREDMSAQHEWGLVGKDGGVFSAGVGGSLVGRPVDLLIIDDPLKDRLQADSETYRERQWDWWTEAGSTRLSPGASVVVITTRWHQDDLVGRLLAAEDGHVWRVINIPAQADHDPAKGEVDVLGRAPGEFLESSRRRTPEQWEAIKVRTGPRSWAALYQGRPSPQAGDLFPAEWARYAEPLWVERGDGSRLIPGRDHEIVQSWDLTFKDTKQSDFVVGQVWMRVGSTVWLLDQVRARLNFTASVDAVVALTAKWPQATAKFVEDKANGPAVINALTQRVPGIIPIEPEGSKYARAAAVSPFAHSKNIVLPDPTLLPNVADLTLEAAGFPNATHDDTIDAMSQAVNRLLLQPILNGDDLITGEDILDNNPTTWMNAGY